MQGLEVYELTNPQKSIWFTEQYYKGTTVNNICGSVLIEQKINIDLLNTAINKFIENNDSFRIRLKLIDGNVYQYFTENTNYNFDIINLKDCSEIQQHAKHMVSIPFDMIDSKLFDFKLFQLANGYGGFIINAHHIISDAATFSFIATEVTSNYSMLLKNEPIPKKEYSYVDYIKSEKDYLTSKRFEKDKAYWNELLTPIPDVATIPTLKNNELDSNLSLRKECTFTHKQLKIIKDFCNKYNISLFNFLVAVYSIYIGRVNNLDNFLIGTPILNRTTFAEKHTSGMYISTSILNINLSNDLSFVDFIKEVGKSSMSLLRHQKYNYQFIIDDLRKKDKTIPNLYNIILSYQITKATNLDSDIKYESKWYENNCISNDLEIHFHDNDNTGNLSVEYDYKKCKYTNKDMEDIHRRILHIINQILSNENTNLKDIEIVTEDEKNEILNIFKDSEATYPTDITIVDIFEKQVDETPDNIAISYNGKTLTYSELNKKSNSLANYLRKKGVSKGTPVALRMNTSFEMPVAILAIIKAGGYYVPINLTYPEERCKFILDNSQSKILLTTNSNKDDYIFESQEVICVDFSNDTIYNLSNSNLPHVNTPTDLLYIIYTSGTTGVPKGVMIMHKNVVRLLKNSKFQFNFNDKDIWTMFHSVAFDFSVWEFYGALLFGGKLVLVPNEIAIMPNKFLRLLRKEKVTILNQTPTYFYNLLDNELLIKDSNLNIRYIIFGGEELKPQLIYNWKVKYPNTHLINMYGITETTVHVTFRELLIEDLKSPDSNIGKPIPTLNVYLMDKNLKLVPYGVEGEICVSGEGLAKGYLNRPELNKTKFVLNPYKPNEIIYRSGDSAILSEDGNLYYKGRIDKQVKIRGFRIELGELEEKILNYPDIDKCVVLPQKNNNKESYLVAYIVANKETSIPKLKSYLSLKLPKYMIPNYFVVLEKIPLNVNGKVDRNALSKMEHHLCSENEYVAPRNEFEKILQKTIIDITHINQIGIDDNILNSGADSISLMQITIKLLELNYNINLQDIYELKTIRNISNKLYSPVEKSISSNFDGNTYVEFNNNFSNKTISLENVLLTGVTGFVGIHILHYLLENTDAKIYCLIRTKYNIEPQERLSRLFKYYFNEEFIQKFASRIIYIDGQIDKEHLSLDGKTYSNLTSKIDTVIHSAANVNHYGKSINFKDTNVIGTENIINFCQKCNAKLNYISTVSISGYHTDKTTDNIEFNEKCLYIGQDYSSNIYIKTKFEAECKVLEAKNNGLDVIIYRLGNIGARYSDGKFQINFEKNAFLNRTLTILKLGKLPTTIQNELFDISPVDITSKFIVELLKYSSSYGNVFHIYNNNLLTYDNLFNIFNRKNIEIVNLENFVNEIKHNGEIALGVINDLNTISTIKNKNISTSCDLTVNYLNNLGLKWPIIDSEYLSNFLDKYIKE